MSTTPTTATTTTDVDNLRFALRLAGVDFADRLADLAGAADELVQLEGELRIAENQAGIGSTGLPPARELAVDMLHGRLGSLRPYIPFVSAESADRATECLVAEPAPATAPPAPDTGRCE